MTATTPHAEKHTVLATIGFSILLWLLLIARQFAFLYSYDALSKVLLILQWTPAAAIVACLIRSFISLSRSAAKPCYRALILLLLFITLAADALLFGILRSDGLQTGGYFSVADKYRRGSSYFISVKNNGELTEIPIDKQTFDRLIIDKDTKYHIEYRTSRLSEKGILESPIDPARYIDNRK